MLESIPCSQIGGLPSWVQDFEYPTCRGCTQTMPFVGQVAVEDIDDSGEGLFYAFLCTDCGKSTTVFQQT